MECDGAIVEGEAMGGTTRGGPTTKVKEEEGLQPVPRRGKVSRQQAKLKCLGESKQQDMDENAALVAHVEGMLFQGEMKQLKVAELKQYLRAHGLDDKGKKDQLIDRVITFVEQKNAI